MRKHNPRKWLHAILDLLPVIFIPVFMVYSHRHTIDNLQVQYAQNEVVDFNQHFTENDFSRDFNYVDKRTMMYSSYFWENHVYILRFTVSNISYTGTGSRTFSINTGNDTSFGSVPNLTNGVFNLRSISQSTGYMNYFYLPTGPSYDTTLSFTFSNYNIFDLTQMFGVGNEPSLEQFNAWYPDQHYDFVESRQELIKDVRTVTYNNSDIGSQLLYSIYTPVRDYMNFNNVFNFGQIYDWLQLNIFGGTAPMSVFIVWNIILYEFLMDLIFIFYAFFMFLIDFCECLLEKPFNKIR